MACTRKLDYALCIKERAALAAALSWVTEATFGGWNFSVLSRYPCGGGEDYKEPWCGHGSFVMPNAGAIPCQNPFAVKGTSFVFTAFLCLTIRER
jgi:hypothetical protein